MKLPIHNPPRQGKRARKKTRARARAKGKKEDMAKKRKKKGRRSSARSTKSTQKKKRNPSRPKRTRARARRSSGHAMKSTGRRRRRNPSKMGKSSAMTIGLAAGAGVLTAAAVTLAGALIAPTSVPVHLGMAGAGVVAGVAVAAKRPAIGGAIAAGSLATATLPWLVGKGFSLLAASKAAPNQGAIKRLGAVVDVPKLGAFNPQRQAPFAAATPWGAATC